jgi:phthiodiolone/phenolphthiodiolone dimycocerosates ketoreductase
MAEFREAGFVVVPAGPDPHEAIELAIHADRLGFDHVRLPDHATWVDLGGQVRDVWLYMAAIGVQTHRIRLSTGVTDPYRRHPHLLAQSVATLDQLTGGRAALGIGAGEDMNLLMYGLERRKPYTALKEAIQIVKLLWEATPQAPASFKGEVFTLDRAFLQVRPVQKPHPPIYIGAVGPRTRELVGLEADGFYPIPVITPEVMQEYLRDVERGVRMAGRQLGEIDRVAFMASVVAEDVEAALQAVAPAVRADLVFEQDLLRRLGYGRELPRFTRVQRIMPNREEELRALHAICETIPLEVVEQVSAVGLVDDVTHRWEQLIQAGATSIAFYTVPPYTAATLEAYGRHIIPYLRDNYG